MIKEIKELHSLGLAIHWLKPRSKAPVRSGWSKGERESWQALIEEYQRGVNVGVRLGRASSFGESHLAAIDCDVKSKNPQHFREMEESLKALINKKAPTVLSGRGNGSKHLYIRTKDPIKPFRYAQSKDIVKVKMPSNDRPSKREIEKLTGNEIAEGYRLRPAWEISVMGEGQQVVLPPSIHPDSGKPYRWAVPFKSTDDLPLLENFNHASESTADSVTAFKTTDIVLEDTNLREKTKALIESGDGCSDRSAALFTVAIEMVNLGMTDSDILTLLTNRDHYLGQCAYEHVGTSSRVKAAKWVQKHTLDKVKREYSIAAQFEAEVVETYLDAEAAKDQLKGLKATESEWPAKLQRTDNGKVRSTFKNLLSILINGVSLDVYRKDEFAGVEVYGCDTPWGGVKGHELVDADDLNLKEWLTRKWDIEPQRNLIIEVVTFIAHRNRFHPVRDWLARLPAWDGTPRIDSWLKDYLNAEAAEPYLSAVSRKMLVAMIARVMRPGCKFDHVLILEGLQGKGKSTAAQILADPWFSDAHIDINNKDSVMNIRAVWLLEMGELSSMRQVEVNQLKGFISRQTDRMRPPYGRRAENFPRQCVFIGTTNPGDYLKDQTGNRRFWPVKVGQVDFDGLRQVRDQLLAEAIFTYNLGENLWLDKVEEIGAFEEQEGRTFKDEWIGIIGDFLAKNKADFSVDFTIQKLFEDFGPLPGKRSDRADQMRAADALRALGYEKTRFRKNGENPRVFWKRAEK